MTHYISNQVLVLEQIEALIESNSQLKLSEEALLNIQKCQHFLQNAYNTPPLQYLTQLEGKQHQLLRNYACGIGSKLPNHIVKLMLLLKIQSLSYGYSGVRLEVEQRLIDFYNQEVYPVVYTKDIPDERIALAQLALPLFGEGEVSIQQKTYAAQELQAKYGWQPLSLTPREAEALINGTQLTTAYCAYNLIKALKIIQWADIVASISTQVFGGSLTNFSPAIQIVRPHKGLIETTEHLRNLLSTHTAPSEDNNFKILPEAFSSIPQIHGAVRETIASIRKVIKTEINSATDNPILFHENKEVIFGGNSHTLPLSLSMDFLAITLTSLGNISERRVFYLITKHQEQSELIEYPIFQRIIEGLLNENRRLSTPSSIESPILFEKSIDIKGMGGSAAVKCEQIIRNIEQILAIELILAASVWKMRKISSYSAIFEEYLSFMAANEGDNTLKQKIENTLSFFNKCKDNV